MSALHAMHRNINPQQTAKVSLMSANLWWSVWYGMRLLVNPMPGLWKPEFQ